MKSDGTRVKGDPQKNSVFRLIGRQQSKETRCLKINHAKFIHQFEIVTGHGRLRRPSNRCRDSPFSTRHFRHRSDPSGDSFMWRRKKNRLKFVVVVRLDPFHDITQSVLNTNVLVCGKKKTPKPNLT